MNEELMTGRNPSADQALARDLGVTITPEEQDEVPHVILGNSGYETDASGVPIESTIDHIREERRKIAFDRGLIFARTVILTEMKKHPLGDVREALSAAWEAVNAVNVDQAWAEINK